MDPSEDPILQSLYEQAPRLLPDFLRERRWFAGKARQIRGVQIVDITAVPLGQASVYFLFVRVTYSSGPDELYDIPLTLRAGDSVLLPSQKLSIYLSPHQRQFGFGDALSNPELLTSLLKAITDNHSSRGVSGEIQMRAGDSLHQSLSASAALLTPLVNQGEQSNSSIFYGNILILKLFRRLEPGINPDLEVGRFLTEKTSFRNIAPVAGSIEYVSENKPAISLAILQAFVPNHGDAWQFTLQQLTEYLQSTASVPEVPGSIFDLSRRPMPRETRSLIGEYLNWAELLGRRTAELHLALASATANEDFEAEPFTSSDQKEFAAAATTLLESIFQLLRQQSSGLPGRSRDSAEKLLNREPELQRRLQLFANAPVDAVKTRIHGDYHLGQVLFTGSDFIIIDFEGEPSRPLSERRKKRSPLQDVAGMLRSFHYAASAAGAQKGGKGSNEAATYWQKWVSAAFLRKYREVAGSAPFLPGAQTQFELMLNTFLLDKAVYELGYELNNRPSWIHTPLNGLLQICEEVQ